MEVVAAAVNGPVATQNGDANGDGNRDITDAMQVNLVVDPAYAAKLKEMEALLQSEMKRLGDPHRLWDQNIELLFFRAR